MTAPNSLAIFGGNPTFQEKLRVGCPNTCNRRRLWERINNLLDRRWLTNNGPFVGELEQRISEMIGVKHCIATCNGTTALQIAARAAGLKGEVIVPSFTFIATAHALQWLGITPVFCDIVPGTHNINPRQVEEMITPRTTGILGVHVWGRPCDVVALAEVARRRNLKLLYDAAHAFGCSHQDRMIGNFGGAEVFSFHATKFFNTFEGGAVVTNDDKLALRLRLMKDYGFSNHDRIDYIGTNGKMSEVSAAMGLTLLESLDELIAVNYRNYKQYQHELERISGILLITYDEEEKCNYQYIVIEIDQSVAQIDRDQLAIILCAENVQVQRYFHPGCHKMEPYHSQFPSAGVLLPETEKTVQRVLVLPTGTAIGPDEVSKICQIIRLVVAHGREVRERLEEMANSYKHVYEK
jgi:dTDP-4-amino-4,6-dideoxygalactose transaminase